MTFGKDTLRFDGLVAAYVFFLALYTFMFLSAALVSGRLGGTLLHAYAVGAVLGYWIWKASMLRVVRSSVVLLEATAKSNTTPAN